MVLKHLQYLLIPLISALLCGGDHTTIESGPRSSRHLVSRSSTLSPIRLSYYYYNFTLNNQTLEDQFKSSLIPQVNSYFTTSLRVYPIQDNLKLSSSSCLSAVKVPSEHKTEGVSNTDVLIYITTNQLKNVNYVAYAGACETDQYALGNVLAGTVVINVPNFSDNSMEEWLANIAHEMSHLLGFSSGLMSKWRNSTGQLYSSDQIKKKVTVRGVEKSILITPNVLAKARTAFNCLTMEGVELEEAGGDGTAGSHWDKRIMMNDYMTAFIPADGIFSDVSLALFQDTGWYDVDYTLAQSPYFGRNMGCDFLEKKCLINEVPLNSTMWCVNQTKWGCDFFGINKGGCKFSNYSDDLPESMQYFSYSKILGGGDKYMDYCPYNMPLTNGKCRGGGAVSTYVFTNSYEVIGAKSRCFESTLMKKPYKVSSSTTIYAACYEVIACNSTKVTIKIEDSIVYCSFEGENITLSGWNGWFKCPSDRRICSDIPCASYCSARGSCSGQGICSCFSGFGGDICNVTCNANCKECSNTENCTSCLSNYFLKTDRCCPSNCDACNISSYCETCSKGYKLSQGECKSCSSGYYLSEEKCLKCSSHCLSCSESGQCSECEDNYHWIQSQCCPYNCLECNSTSFCLTCDSDLYIDSNGKCQPCPVGTFFSDNTCKSCISNCDVCSDASTCDSCSSSYQKINQMCCPQHCSECNQSSFCFTCNSEYFLNDGSSETPCVKCKENCLTCKNSQSCDECIDSKALPDSKGDCSCISGYFHSNDSKTCTPCYSECETCRSKFICETCKVEGAVAKEDGIGCECPEGFYLDSSCKKCDSECFTCETSTTCLKCRDLDKEVNKSNGICQCKIGMFLISDGSCSPCNENCRICGKDNVCVECRDLNADPGRDCKCKTGYFLDGISCYLCPEDCKECDDFYTCTQCLNQNTYPENNCTCDEESMKISKNICICQTGYNNYQTSSFSCLKCTRWLQKEDLSLVLRSSFFELDIFLNFSLSLSLQNLSFALDQASQKALGLNFEEFKLNSTHFLFQLGQNNLIFNKNLTFNLSLLFANTLECGFEAQGPTTLETKNPFGLPSPSSTIKAPKEFGYDCKLSQSFILSGNLSTGGLGKDLSCSWDLSPKLDLPESELKSCSIQVTAKLVTSVSELKVVLTVENYLGRTSSSSAKVKIFQKVEVSVDLFGNNSCSPSKKCLVFVDRITRCNKEKMLTYRWTLMNNTGDNIRKLQETTTLPFLVIYPNTLTPGNWTFKLTVNQDSQEIESFSFNLRVLPEKPKILIDKSQGPVSVFYDFFLNASKSFDPNLLNLEGGVFCEWKCFYQSKSCDFQIDVSDCTVKVLQKYLETGKISQIWLKVTSIKYKTWSETFFQVTLVDLKVPEVKIFEWKTKEIPEKIPLNKPTRFSAVINSTRSFLLKWSTNSIHLSNRVFVDVNPSKLAMIRGNVYSLKLNLIDQNSENLVFFEEFQVNSPPLFGGFSVSPGSGKESLTEFSFIAKDWRDDEEDYPLIYFFSFKSNSGAILLRSSQSNFLLTTLPYLGNPSEATCRVSDSLEDYTEVKTEVKVEKMQDSEVKNYKKQHELIEPPTNIPLILANLLSFTLQRDFYTSGQFTLPDSDTLDDYQEIYDFCLEKIEKFLKFSENTDSFVEITLALLLGLTSNPALKTESNFKSTLAVVLELIEKLSIVGVEKSAGDAILKVLENIYEMDDELVTRKTFILSEITAVVERVNLLVLKRIKDGQNGIISSERVFCYLFAVESKDFQGFRYKNSEFSVDLPASAFDSSGEGFLLGLMTTHFKLKPATNSSHELVSLSTFNVTGSQRLAVVLNENLILIQIPVNYSYPNNDYGKCSYLNSYSGWDDFGCELQSLYENSVVCRCAHLTTFAYVSESFDEDDGSENHRPKEFTAETLKLPGFLLCLTLFVLYNLLLVRIRITKYEKEGKETKNDDLKVEEAKEEPLDEKVNERKEKQHKNTEIATDRKFRYEKILKKKISENPEIVYEEPQFKGDELIIEIPVEKYQDENDLNIGDSLDVSKSNLKYSSNLILDQFHTVHILMSLKKYRNHSYLLSRSFFLFIVSVLFDCLYYDYSYRNTSVDDFEDFLKKNLILFNVITILFSAAVVISVRLFFYFILHVVLYKKLKTMKYLALSILFILTFVYFSYLISCFSNGFTRFVNNVWVVCAIFSIVLEISLFDPFSHLFASLAKRIYIKFLRKEEKK